MMFGKKANVMIYSTADREIFACKIIHLLNLHIVLFHHFGTPEV